MEPVHCANREYPLIFESSVEPYPKIIPVMSKSNLSDLGISTCCFRKIWMAAQTYEGVIMGKECTSLSLENETRMPENWEFVTVECDYLASKHNMRVVDIHAFPYPNKTKPFDKITTGGIGPLNVLILGMDAMSHLNFRRTMPEVHEFLTKNLSAFEFMGYHKIGENTFPKIGPLLTNREIVYYGKGDHDNRLDCEKDKYVDNCPFLWKRFKQSGYITLFAEDTYGMNIFKMERKGFSSPPVDHYFLPFEVAAQRISHTYKGMSPVCYGPRSAFQVLINYAEKLATSADSFSLPYFQFVFSGSVTHQFVNGPRIILKDLLKTLQFFQQRSFLNNTLLILLSDHGSRIDEIRAHPQGYLEDKLPLLYFVVPQWFQKMYPRAYSNLQVNTRRLITPRDVYKTLADILPKKNGLELDNLQTGGGNQDASPGISMFQQIPLSRTCETANIKEQFCGCNITLSVTLATDAPMVVKGAKATLEHINGVLGEGDKNEGVICAKLSLGRILRAEQLKTFENGSKLLYRLVLMTTPGNATFEAEVSKGKHLLGEVKVIRVRRLNKYRNQSQCIHNANLKPFCYCKI